MRQPCSRGGEWGCNWWGAMCVCCTEDVFPVPRTPIIFSTDSKHLKVYIRASQDRILSAARPPPRMPATLPLDGIVLRRLVHHRGALRRRDRRDRDAERPPRCLLRRRGRAPRAAADARAAVEAGAVRAALPTHVAPRRQAWAWTLPSFRRCLRKNQAGRIESPQLAFFWHGLNRVLR